MTRALSLDAEIFQRSHQAGSEVMMPDAIHHHPRGERMIGLRQPPGKKRGDGRFLRCRREKAARRRTACAHPSAPRERPVQPGGRACRVHRGAECRSARVRRDPTLRGSPAAAPSARELPGCCVRFSLLPGAPRLPARAVRRRAATRRAAVSRRGFLRKRALVVGFFQGDKGGFTVGLRQLGVMLAERHLLHFGGRLFQLRFELLDLASRAGLNSATRSR